MFRSVLGHFFKSSRFTLDNFVFRLHYRVTVGLLLTCVVAILWKINYGNPMKCMSGDEFDGADQCWYYGTFTYPDARYKIVGREVPAPGIDQGVYDTVEWHNTHRWVIICLLIQALFFFLPRILWRTLEGRRVYRLTWNMNNARDPEEESLRKRYVLDYLTSNSNILYVMGHAFCELLNFLNVVVQLSLVSHILQVPAVTLDMLTKGRAQRTDDSALAAFPLAVKCNLYRYGAAGHINKHDFFCVMTINGTIEAILCYIWIWFLVLTLLSALAIAYRVITVIIPPLRVWRLESKTKLTGRKTIEEATRRLNLGQWFLLYLLSKNMDPLRMKEILESLSKGKQYQAPSMSMKALVNNEDISISP